jgi:hypothetical protein
VKLLVRLFGGVEEGGCVCLSSHRLDRHRGGGGRIGEEESLF